LTRWEKELRGGGVYRIQKSGHEAFIAEKEKFGRGGLQKKKDIGRTILKGKIEEIEHQGQKESRREATRQVTADTRSQKPEGKGGRRTKISREKGAHMGTEARKHSSRLKGSIERGQEGASPARSRGSARLAKRQKENGGGEGATPPLFAQTQRTW